MLRVTLLGNLGADPEVRFTQKGSQMVQFRVAVNQVRTGADGERQENTEWFRIRVSGRQQDFAQRLVKGNRVLVMGRLDIGHYQSREGEARVSYDVWADEIQAMSGSGTGTRAYGADMDGPEADAEAEAEAGAEPAVAGVSSLNGNGAGSSGGRGRAARGGDAAGRGGARQGDDLEDVPF